VSIKELIKE